MNKILVVEDDESIAKMIGEIIPAIRCMTE